jgi:hypothetical protein
MASEHTLRWEYGHARIITLGAMLAECTFFLPNGPFQPFARAPWAGTIDDPEIPGHLRELAGDFVCVPFGRDGREPAGPADWRAVMGGQPTHVTHGPAADSIWTIIDANDTSVALALDYPDGDAVERLERTVRVRPDAPIIEFSLTIIARRKTTTTIGLHPNFRLPELTAGLRLSADFDFGLVHPGQVTLGTEQTFSTLAAVPFEGRTIDLSGVPVGLPNVSVQLCGMRGPLTGSFEADGAGFELDWDRHLLPSLQIWHTDRGIAGPPWNNQFRGIGLEPVVAAFDLGNAVGTADNPVNRRGVPTALALDPNRPTTIRHRVSAFAL